MRSLLHLATQCYLILAVLAGVPAGASRVVLCVAPNGHVAIEVGEGRCEAVDAPAVDATALDAPRMAPEGCDDCVDVPVGAPILSEARGRNLAAGSESSAPSTVLSTGHAVPLPTASMHARLVPHAASHAAFPPSRTTILRN